MIKYKTIVSIAWMIYDCKSNKMRGGVPDWELVVMFLNYSGCTEFSIGKLNDHVEHFPKNWIPV